MPEPGSTPAPRAAERLLEVSELRVALADGTVLVDGVDLHIGHGEIVGVVGESGAGKSMTALAIVRMLPAAAHIAGGRVLLGGQDLAQADARTLQQVRGGQVGMVFQDPLSSLNPLMSVGAQIEEGLRLHGASRAAARARAVELLDLVGIREPARAVRSQPHEFSGGMRQRVMIAIAVANNPRLVIADEPTTGLDVTIQAEVLSLLTRLRAELGVAVMLITHDVGVVEEICDRTTVLYAGRVVEVGGRESVFTVPRHPYTAQLMRSVPQLHGERGIRLPVIPGAAAAPGDVPVGCAFAPRCAFVEDRCRRAAPELAEVVPGQRAACWASADGALRPLEALLAQPPVAHVSALAGRARGRADGGVGGSAPADGSAGRAATTAPGRETTTAPAPAATTAPGREIIVARDVHIRYGAGRRRDGKGPLPAVDGVSLTVRSGRVLGLIGESGSGKTSIARAMVGLIEPVAGSVEVGGLEWRRASRRQKAEMRRRVQLVFQDSLASMDPRWRVRQIVSEPLRGREPAYGLTIDELMDAVGLRSEILDRYPDELSGGQRQRVGIARALSSGPSVIIADEPVSALDVSVQAQVINLLSDLRDDFGVGLVIVAHDLAVAWHIADEIAVMQSGRVVEQGPPEQVLKSPQHPYTAKLVASIPGQDRRLVYEM